MTEPGYVRYGCPTCGTRPYETCRSLASGRSTNPHQSRLLVAEGTIRPYTTETECSCGGGYVAEDGRCLDCLLSVPYPVDAAV